MPQKTSLPRRRDRFALPAVGVLVLVLLAGCERKKDAAPKPEAPLKRFGISFHRREVRDTVVPRNGTLGSILGGIGLSGQACQRLVDASKGVFDLRSLRTGRPLHLISDSTGRVRHLVYERDPFRWIRFDLDTLLPLVVQGEERADTVERTVGGTIDGSLWENLIAQGHSPELVGKVADILAWQVDFFSVQPGDRYRVVYQELRMDGRPVALGEVLAVSFEQQGRLSKAYRFTPPDGRGGYYDANGSPCKRQFLKAPLQFSRISSRFSSGRMHPVLRIVRPHYGVDYAAPPGTPVMCVGSGTVLARGWDPKGGGNYVKIRHNATFTTCYMHLKGIATAMRTGAAVSQGEVLGWVGMTGLATGPHLDFRFFRDGRPVNPLTVEPPPAPPLPDSLRSSFQAVASRLNSTLEAVAADFRPRAAGRRR